MLVQTFWFLYDLQRQEQNSSFCQGAIGDIYLRWMQDAQALVCCPGPPVLLVQQPPLVNASSIGGLDPKACRACRINTALCSQNHAITHSSLQSPPLTPGSVKVSLILCRLLAAALGAEHRFYSPLSGAFLFQWAFAFLCIFEVCIVGISLNSFTLLFLTLIFPSSLSP